MTTFDTGFPVDFSTLRSALGPEVVITGGVEVQTLLQADPRHVYRCASEILRSPVNLPGKFALREANNLPVGVPWSNLAAMYQAAFEAGKY